MTENDTVPGGLAPPTAPQISDATVTYERQLLADRDWCERYPQQAAALRASLETAIAVTGWKPPSDPRTPAQIAHDRRHGMTVTPDGRTALPEPLARLVRGDGAAVDAEAVAAQLGRAGHDPATILADAAEALQRAGSDVQAETLSAHALAQLAVWARHVREASKSRPQ